MHRSTTRLTAAAAALAACGLVLTGCSAGQISQTATQEAAVNGTSANLKDIALRNVHLQVAQTGDFVQPGTVVPLVFLAANDSPEFGDKLLGITSEVGQVTFTGDGAIPARGALVVNAPAGQGEAPAANQAMRETAPGGEAAAAAPAGAQVTLSQPITNGLSYDFTFTFEKSGKTTVAVPVSAGES